MDEKNTLDAYYLEKLETLNKLVRKYSVTLQEIRQLNDLQIRKIVLQVLIDVTSTAVTLEDVINNIEEYLNIVEKQLQEDQMD